MSVMPRRDDRQLQSTTRMRACLALLAVGASARVMVDTQLPLVEIAWSPEQPARTGAFIGSPSIVAPPGAGFVLASHDWFFDQPVGTAVVLASQDNGTNWSPVANVSSMYWAQLFARPHASGVGSEVYLIGTSGDMTTPASINIARCIADSGDPTGPCQSGRTWTSTVTLFAGSANRSYHAAPTPVVALNGGWYRSFEVAGPWVPSGVLALVLLRADQTCADLTIRSCWSMGPPRLWNESWAEKAAPARIAPMMPADRWRTVDGLPLAGGEYAWEESNAIADASGNLWIMARLDSPLSNCSSVANCNRAALLRADPATLTLTWDSIVPLPSGCNKFAVRLDPVTGWFFALTNPVTAQGVGVCSQRNVVTLVASQDLRTWRTCSTVLYDDTGFDFADSVRYTGLQYVDWFFNGTSLVAAVRAGYRGSVSYHNANRLVLTRVDDYATACGVTRG